MISKKEKKNAIVLDQWSLVTSDTHWDRYTAPELLPTHLRGKIRVTWDEDASRFVAGKCIETTSITETDGRYVRTRGKGRIYYLGVISPNFLSWIKASGHGYDRYHPFGLKIHTSNHRG